MHIAYVIDSLSNAGGAERSLAQLALALREREQRVSVIVLTDRGGFREQLQSSDIRVTTLAGSTRRLARVRSCARVVEQLDPDLVHTSLFEADVIGRLGARLARRPVSSSLVSTTYGSSHTSDPVLRAWKVRLAQVTDASTARLTPRLHAVSEEVADVMARRLRYPRARIDVIHRGRDPKSLGEASDERRRRARRTLGVSPQERVILVVARQEFPKGIDLMLAALPLVLQTEPDARLVIAGREGAATPEITRVAHDLEVANRVSLLGQREDVADLMCGADVLALPSRREGFPGVLVEAMALGLPIVASDLPQVREVVGGAYATISSPDDAERWSRSIVETLRDRPAAAHRAQNARARFEAAFTLDKVADAMLAFHRRCVDESGTRLRSAR